MSGQIDVGWAAAPFGVNLLGREIREIYRGAQVAAIRDQTVRCLAVHAEFLATRKDDAVRFMRAYRETLDWMYAGDEALGPYATFAGISRESAKRTRDEYFPKAALDPARLEGLESLVADAVAFKFIRAPLTQAQLAELVQIQKE